MLNKVALVMITVSLIAGCSSDSGVDTVNWLNTKSPVVFTIDVKGKLNNASTFFQPAGSEQVYILNRESGWVYCLKTSKGLLNPICKLPALPAESGLVGFTAGDSSGKIRLFYNDSVTSYSSNGSFLSTYLFDDIAASGYIYPLDNEFLPVFKNGKMYAPHYPKITDGNVNPIYYKIPVEAEIDLKSGKVALMDQAYPENYMLNYYSFGTEPARMEISENVHGYLFPQNDSIYIRNIRTGELEIKFFGSRMHKKFEYIPFRKINSVNASAFDEIGLKNPFYIMPYNFPLAGYFGRNIVFPPDKTHKEFKQYVTLFNRQFEYEGEIHYPNAFLIDSKKGIMMMNCSDGKLKIKKLVW